MPNERSLPVLKVGASRFSNGGHLVFNRYECGQIAIQVFSEEGPEYTATVAMVNDDPDGEYGVWLKGWDTNEGVPEALQAAGLVKLTGRTVRAGYAKAVHAELAEHVRPYVDQMDAVNT